MLKVATILQVTSELLLRNFFMNDFLLIHGRAWVGEVNSD